MLALTPKQNHRTCLERQKRYPAGTGNSTNGRLTGQKSKLFQWLALQLRFAADKDNLPTDSGVPPCSGVVAAASVCGR
jgi:hypothetical protein